MPAETTYVDKTKKNYNVDLWYICSSHVSYDKMELMMKKKMVNGLTHLEVNKGLVFVGCHFAKSEQLPYEKSSFQSKVLLELVHFDVFDAIN